MTSLAIYGVCTAVNVVFFALTQNPLNLASGVFSGTLLFVELTGR